MTAEDTCDDVNEAFIEGSELKLAASRRVRVLMQIEVKRRDDGF